MSLFLYLDADAGLTLLREARLPFQSIAHLQDPFLTNHAVRAEAARGQASQQEIDAEILRQYHALPPHLAELVSLEYFREQALGKRAELEAAVLARDQKPDVELLTPTQLHALTVLRLFSSGQNPLLWERYGDSYRGMVVELDPQNELLKAPLYQGKPQLLQAVNYADERPLAGPGSRFPSLFHRPRAYASEGEWRLLRPRVVADKVIERHGWEICLYKFSSRAVRRLMLGCNMPVDQRERILKLIEHDQRYRHLERLECCVDPYRYEIHLRAMERNQE